MPFVPHTQEDTQEMLDAIGFSDISDVFKEIPNTLKTDARLNVGEALSEQAVTKHMIARAMRHDRLCFIGAGAYQHFIPAAIWDIVGRGEFLTAYTPYQAEASQGNLQIIYEYQTMMCELLDMDASNASMYDGASALAEAILMALRTNKKNHSTKVLLTGPANPRLMSTLKTLLQHTDVELSVCRPEAMVDEDSPAAIVIHQPSFRGHILEADELTDWAHQCGASVIAYVNPIAMALLKPPGQWGEKGADIVCGEGQPLGIPLSFGGPYFGFMACKIAHIRQLPGRIVGKTQDTQGRPAYCLTLQAREQHIRRAKATSNICTNQGLMLVAATMYMGLMGPHGLREVALSCHKNANTLKQRLSSLEGVHVEDTPFFHEFIIKCADIEKIVSYMSEQHIAAGHLLAEENTLLVCATDCHDDADLDAYVKAFETGLNTLSNGG